jgi:hypothetical protein
LDQHLFLAQVKTETITLSEKLPFYFEIYVLPLRIFDILMTVSMLVLTLSTPIPWLALSGLLVFVTDANGLCSGTKSKEDFMNASVYNSLAFPWSFLALNSRLGLTALFFKV